MQRPRAKRRKSWRNLKSSSFFPPDHFNSSFYLRRFFRPEPGECAGHEFWKSKRLLERIEKAFEKKSHLAILFLPLFSQRLFYSVLLSTSSIFWSKPGKPGRFTNSTFFARTLRKGEVKRKRKWGKTKAAERPKSKRIFAVRLPQTYTEMSSLHCASIYHPTRGSLQFHR